MVTQDEVIESLEYNLDCLMDKKQEIEQEIDLYEEDYSCELQDELNAVNQEINKVIENIEKLSRD